jgi:hypothetical protein
MRIIAKIEKGTEELRVCLHEWKGQVYVDIRLWYRKGDDFLPGYKGLRFSAELLPELRSAVEEAEAAIERGQETGELQREGPR